VELFRKTLNRRMETSNMPAAQRCQEYILQVALEQKRSIMGYQGAAATWILMCGCVLALHTLMCCLYR
jgi:hypothetical protein